MIFVTVGTTGFDVLIEHIDKISLDYDEPFVVQIGPGKYIPKNCDYFRYSPSLQNYFQQAAIIISHGGFATVTEVLRLGIPLIAVEDVNQPDRHQREILQVWSEKKQLLWCPELNFLPTYIEKARTESLVPYEEPVCEIQNYVIKFIENVFSK